MIIKIINRQCFIKSVIIRILITKYIKTKIISVVISIKKESFGLGHSPPLISTFSNKMAFIKLCCMTDVDKPFFCCY